MFGHFSADGRSYTITDPATPRPWCNVICNGRYGLVVSQRGGGFSWFDDAQHNVLTRWEMDLVRDCSGKFLFLADLDDGVVWSAAPAPCGTAHDAYACTHEPGLTTFTTEHRGIRCVWTLVVDAHEGVEVWALTLTNLTSTARNLRVGSYLEWTCGVAPDVKREFHRLFFTTSYDAQRNTVIATKNMWDIPGLSEKEHWNKDWPHAAAHALCGGDFSRTFAIANKETFLGRYGSTASPAAMRAGLAKGWGGSDGGFGRFGDACAALGGDLTLAPNASTSFHLLIAIDKDEQGVRALIDRFRDPATPSRTIEGARKFWREHLSATRVASQLPAFDALQNTWLPYQALSARLWGRTGYYQQSGAFGFRDQLQDSHVWLPINPQRCADQIMLHASRMFEDGSVNHWWHALADFGNRTACSDDYLWLAFVTSSYIRETADYAILERAAPYQQSAKIGSLREHCLRGIDRAFQRLSPRGLPLIGSCDWNDGLSALGLEERGESVWLAMFLASILADWSLIATHTHDASLASRCAERRAALLGAIHTHAWDSAGYFQCATKDSGEWIGASTCAQGAIHLNPQTWSILANAAPPDRQRRAWEAVKQKLLTPYGPLLLAPAYTTPDPDIGYITRYSPGSRENGGVYMHAATWALAAACAMRDRDAAGAIWNSIAPPVRGENAEAYAAEPYVLPGNVDGPLSETPGKAGWTWYTGSAAWLQRVCMEWVLGVRPIYTPDSPAGGLLIDPVPPEQLGAVEFERTWRGRRLRIAFDARDFRTNRPASVVANGQKLPDNTLKPEHFGKQKSATGPVDIRVSWSE